MTKFKLIDIEEFRASARAGNTPKGTRPEEGIMRAATGPAEDMGGRTLRYCFSDGTVDRAGDTIDQSGWDLAAFNRNPVALWSHMSWDPPIGTASNVAPKDGRLMGDITYAERDQYPFADTIFQLAKGKFINAVSVGFIALDWSFAQDKDRPFGLDFHKQELLEISVCSVPCNPNALGAAKAAGIDLTPLIGWAEKLLDTHGSKILVPRAELDAMRKAAGGGRSYVKAGRALSKKNEDELRAAYEKIGAVLASVEQQDGGEDDAPEADGNEPENMPSPDNRPAEEEARALRQREAEAIALRIKYAA
jgi:HK97 family phage prohead protease